MFYVLSLVVSRQVMLCHVNVMLRYSMSRHLKPFHVMLYMYVLIPVMSVHVICHLSHVKSGINTIFVIRTFVCALCWPVEFVKGYASVKENHPIQEAKIFLSSELTKRTAYLILLGVLNFNNVVTDKYCKKEIQIKGGWSQ